MAAALVGGGAMFTAVMGAWTATGLCTFTTVGTTLEVNNGSDFCNIIDTMCDGVNLYDFQGSGCPKNNFQHQKIPKKTKLRHHQEVTKHASNCPWTLHFLFSCGERAIVRGHQKRAIKGHNCTKKKDCFNVRYSPAHRIRCEIDYKNKDYKIKISDYNEHVEFLKSKKKEFLAKILASLATENDLNEAMTLADQSFKHAKASKDKGRIQAAKNLCAKVFTKRALLRLTPVYTQKCGMDLQRLKGTQAETRQQIDAILPKINKIVSTMEDHEHKVLSEKMHVDDDFVEVRDSAEKFQKHMYKKSGIIYIKDLIDLGDLDKAESTLHEVGSIYYTNTEIENLLQKIKDLRDDRIAENLRQTGIGYVKALRFNDARTVFNQALAKAHDSGLKQRITSDIQNAWDCEAENIKKNALQLAKQNQFDKALSTLDEAFKIKASKSVEESIKNARMQILNDQVTWMRKQGDELVTKSKFEDAYKWFNAAVPIPCSSDLKRKVYLSQANAYWTHAKFCVDKELFHEAHEKFDLALKVQNEQLKVEKTIVQITNDKASAYSKEANITFRNACDLENRVDQHEEMCVAAQKSFDEAKELFKKAHDLNASKENSNNLEMCNAKIDGNNTYNKGTDLEVEGMDLYQKSHTKKEFQSAEKKLSDANDEFLEAKKLFKKGSKLCKKNLFESSIKSTQDAIDTIKIILKGITFNLLKLGDTKLNTMLENEKKLAGTSHTEKETQMIVDKA